MLFKNTRIQLLDISNKVSIDDTIGNVFSKYFIKSDELGSIDFNDMNVKISDWTGWTQLLQIRRIENKDIKFLHLHSTENDKLERTSIYLTEDHIIPSYSLNTMNGFHGEVKYSYEMKYVMDDNITMRVFDLSKMNWQAFKDMNTGDIISDNYGYEIYTKSGFYNANNLHLLSSDARMEDGKNLFK